MPCKQVYCGGVRCEMGRPMPSPCFGGRRKECTFFAPLMHGAQFLAGCAHARMMTVTGSLFLHVKNTATSGLPCKNVSRRDNSYFSAFGEELIRATGGGKWTLLRPSDSKETFLPLPLSPSNPHPIKTGAPLGRCREGSTTRYMYTKGGKLPLFMTIEISRSGRGPLSDNRSPFREGAEINSVFSPYLVWEAPWIICESSQQGINIARVPAK